MADIFIYDDLHPEDNAMLQALYSRSPESVVNHLEKVKAAGSGKFMEQFYVGYGHASIGDCGSTTIFIENASMLVAKAIQDHALYSGQEASTRYLDFAKQPLVDPYNSPRTKAILEKWVALNIEYMPKVKEALAQRHPFNAGEHKTEKAWDKAISARAFDILRCLLPVGTGTLLSWHTNLRQARDHLRRIAHHPLPEVRAVAREVYARILDKYKHSFNAEDMNEASERHAARNAYAKAEALADHILMPEIALRGVDAARVRAGEIVADLSLYNASLANQQEAEAFGTRPQNAPLSRRLLQYGVFNLTFLLDFGSYRDLQRHRNGYDPVPLVGPEFGFFPWYTDELKSLLKPADFSALQSEIEKQFKAIGKGDPLLDQYLYPMGMSVACKLTYSLPQMVYVAELRSGVTVHPSLRPIAQQMGDIVQKAHPSLKLYIDRTPESWSFKRGQQDITAKENAA